MLLSSTRSCQSKPFRQRQCGQRFNGQQASFVFALDTFLLRLVTSTSLMHALRRHTCIERDFDLSR